jgi:hypothetical protein
VSGAKRFSRARLLFVLFNARSVCAVACVIRLCVRSGHRSLFELHARRFRPTSAQGGTTEQVEQARKLRWVRPYGPPSLATIKRKHSEDDWVRFLTKKKVDRMRTGPHPAVS